MRALAILALLCCGPSLATVQDGDARDPAAALARQRAYLAREPYSEAVFEQLLAGAAAGEGLEALLEDVRAELAAGGGEAARVLLARLHARAGDVDAARAALAEVMPGPRRALLLGHIELRAGRFEAALAALADVGPDAAPEDRALAAERRGLARLGLGERGRAGEEFFSIAELAPGVDAALDAAELLALHGLLDEALPAYDLALARVTDVERRVGVLVGLAALHERRVDGPAAIEQLRAADALLARGHWRKAEVRARIVDLHRRAGRLEDWIDACRVACEAAPRDVAAREAWADALAAAGRAGQALEALAPAVIDHPRDRALAHRRLAWLRSSGDLEGELAELQRVRVLDPGDVELAFRLGAVLLALEREEAASGRWGELLAAYPEDVQLAVRVARAWGAHGRTERALAAWGAAWARAPEDVQLAAELARALRDAERRGEALAVAATAAERVRELPPLLAETAELYDELGDRAAAIDVLTELLGRFPNEARTRYRLAELLLLEGDEGAARMLLRELIAGAEPNLRRAALDRFARSLRGREQRRLVLDAERAALAQESGGGAVDPARPLIVARLHLSLGERELAQQALGLHVERFPDDVGTREELARRWVQLGRTAAAAAAYAELERLAPERARGFRRARATVLARGGRRAEALELLAESERGARVTPQAALDLARSYADLEAPDRATRLLESALRAHPDNTALRLELARVVRDGERAVTELLRVYRTADADVRHDALAELVRVLQGSPREYTNTLRDLGRAIESNAYDLAARRLSIALRLRFGETARAGRELDELLATLPEDVDALRLRAELRRSEEQWELAASDLERLRMLGADDDERLALDLLDCYLASGRLDDAFALSDAADPLAAAQRFAARDQTLSGVRLLEALVDSPRSSPAAWRGLGDLRRELEDHAGAIEAYREVERAGEADASLYFALVQVYDELGRTDELLEAARAMLRFPDAMRLAKSFFERRRSLRPMYYELIGNFLASAPLDEAHVARQLAHILSKRHDEAAFAAVDALRRVRAETLDAGVWPAEHDAASWDRRLRDWSLRAHMHRTKVARVRIRSLREAIDDSSATRADWYEWAILLQERLRLWGADVERIERAFALYPDWPELHLALAVVCMDGKDERPALAARILAGLVARADASDDGWSRFAWTVYLEACFGAVRGAGSLATAESIEAAARRTWVPEPPSVSAYLPPLDDRSLSLRLAVALARAGQTEQASARFDALEPADDGPLGRRLAFARALYDAEHLERWFEFELALLRLRDELASDEVAMLLTGWQAPFDEHVQWSLRRMRRHGYVAPAYDVLRHAGHEAAYQEFLTDQSALAELESAYLLRVEELRDEPGGADPLELRNELVKLGEVQHRSFSASQLSAQTFDDASRLLEGDHECCVQAFVSADYLGDGARALGALRRAIRAKRRAADPDFEPEAGRLRVDVLASRGGIIASGQVQAHVHGSDAPGVFGSVGRSQLRELLSGLDPLDPLPERLQLVTLLLDLDSDEEAAEALARVDGSRRPVPAPVAQKLYNALRPALADRAALALLDGFVALAPGHLDAARTRVTRLIEERRFADARAALAGFAERPFPDPGTAEKAHRALLSRLERRDPGTNDDD